jgi:hypothetical protein
MTTPNSDQPTPEKQATEVQHYGTFTLNWSQTQKWLEFQRAHRMHQNVRIAFAPTGIGLGVSHICGSCKVEADDSEVETW